MANHTTKRIQVTGFRLISRKTQQMIDMIGTNGTHGVLKGRRRSGCVLRNRKMEKETRVKAVKVPIFTSSAKSANGIKPPMIAAIDPNKTVDLSGAPVLALISLKTWGVIHPATWRRKSEFDRRDRLTLQWSYQESRQGQ